MELRVFLVEDLQSSRILMKELFAVIGGLQVIGAATTEAEAKFWLDENAGAWDVAIIDLILEQGSGLGVIHQAKQSSSGRGTVVVLSSYASPGIREHCMKAGADAIFDKADPTAFVAWLRNLVDGGQPAPSA
jgi:two-component system, OmpR family, response regulator